ncbi:exopolysaccharide biosynthesis protein [Microbulbifer taiwanensis]|uniref:Exopolysaccharide biosynthesis protein n=1 Tax=Microbulbifer taiwanensis TaxID=986746 RepID=A0ABW1YRZ0_9GAMM|nr:exopolysaccharide biosynthesis protein [Microbulbifer taiwanensis]
MPREFTSLTQLLEHISKTAKRRKRVSLDLVVRAVGRRSFAPLLLLVGIILFSPLSGIPGVPTIMGLLVLLTAVQLLLGRSHFWLPQWLLRRSISKGKLIRALHWLQKPARFIDRWLRPRLEFLVGRAGTYVIAAICAVIALALPAMEIVPFSATTAGMALTALGLALVAHDGVLALFAFVVTAFVFGLIAGALF